MPEQEQRPQQARGNGERADRRTCKGTNAQGEPCQSEFVGEDAWCDAHGPGTRTYSPSEGGGWKNVEAMQAAYQQADLETMEKVVMAGEKAS